MAFWRDLIKLFTISREEDPVKLKSKSGIESVPGIPDIRGPIRFKENDFIDLSAIPNNNKDRPLKERYLPDERWHAPSDDESGWIPLRPQKKKKKKGLGLKPEDVVIIEGDYE